MEEKEKPVIASGFPRNLLMETSHRRKTQPSFLTGNRATQSPAVKLACMLTWEMASVTKHAPSQ
jgi:hypothetical protein